MFFLRKDMEILKKGISFLRMIKRLGNNKGLLPAGSKPYLIYMISDD